MTNYDMKKAEKEDALQLYARASAPCRDYYGLTITESNLMLNIWKISYGPHLIPKQRRCSLEDFKEDKSFQGEVRNVFGSGIYDYLYSLSKKQRKLENLPAKLFNYCLSFLAVEDVLRLMCCSKILFEKCNQNAVWRQMFIKKFGRIPSKEETRQALGSCWREVFQRRLFYVRKALRESIEKKKLKKLEIRKAIKT